MTRQSEPAPRREAFSNGAELNGPMESRRGAVQQALAGAIGWMPNYLLWRATCVIVSLAQERTGRKNLPMAEQSSGLVDLPVRVTSTHDKVNETTLRVHRWVGRGADEADLEAAGDVVGWCTVGAAVIPPHIPWFTIARFWEGRSRPGSARGRRRSFSSRTFNVRTAERHRPSTRQKRRRGRWARGAAHVGMCSGLAPSRNEAPIVNELSTMGTGRPPRHWAE